MLSRTEKIAGIEDLLQKLSSDLQTCYGDYGKFPRSTDSQSWSDTEIKAMHVKAAVFIAANVINAKASGMSEIDLPSFVLAQVDVAMRICDPYAEQVPQTGNFISNKEYLLACIGANSTTNSKLQQNLQKPDLPARNQTRTAVYLNL